MTSTIAYIIILVSLCIYGFHKIIYVDRKYSPLRLFCFWWAMTTIMSLYPVWGRNIASEEIYGSILVSIVSFVFGTFSGAHCKINNNDIKSKLPFSNFLNKSKRKIIYLNTIVLLLNFWLFLKCYSIYGIDMFSVMGIAREGIYESDAILSSTIEVYLHSYILRGCLYMIIVCLPLILWTSKGKALSIYSLLNVLFYTFIYGGRMFVFYSGIILYIGIRLLQSQNSIYTNAEKRFVIRFNLSKKQKNKKGIIIIIGVLVAIVIGLTFSRNSSDQSNGIKYFIEKSITYFSSAPIYYQYLQDITASNEQSGFLFTFVGGAITFLSHLNKIIGIQLIPDVVSQASSHLTSNLVNVGGNVFTNAFPTMVYTFRFDFGMLGVCINSFLFGFLSEIVYKKMIKEQKIRYFLLYMVVIYFIVESPMRWTGQQFWPWFVIIMIYFFTKNINTRTIHA